MPKLQDARPASESATTLPTPPVTLTTIPRDGSQEYGLDGRHAMSHMSQAMSHMSQEFAPVSREHGRMSLESLHGLDRLASDDAALFSPPAGLCMCVRGGVGGLGRWL